LKLNEHFSLFRKDLEKRVFSNVSQPGVLHYQRYLLAPQSWAYVAPDSEEAVVVYGVQRHFVRGRIELDVHCAPELYRRRFHVIPCSIVTGLLSLNEDSASQSPTTINTLLGFEGCLMWPWVALTFKCVHHPFLFAGSSRPDSIASLMGEPSALARICPTDMPGYLRTQGPP